jgi:peptidoglycan/LPS O-acetylase OafA/YrhL
MAPPGGRLQRIPPFRTLDAMRGLAAAWVVMLHSCDRFLYGDNMHYIHEPLYAFSMHGQLGVVFFFIISGYCITAAAYSALVSGKPVWRYGYERVRRIYPPYLAALVLSAAAILLIGYADAHHWVGSVHHLKTLGTSPRYWIGNILLLQSELNTGMVNIVSWSLCIEVAYYVVIGLWLWLAQVIAVRRGLAAGTLVMVLGIAATTVASLTTIVVYGDAISPFNGWYYFGWHYFASGGILFFLVELNQKTVAEYSNRLRWLINGTAALVVAVLVTCIVIHPEMDADPAHPSSQVRSITCLLFCLMLVGLHRVDARLTASKWMRPFFWLGACSYSLYLVHPVVIPFVDILCRKAGLSGNWYWITFWIQFVVAIVFGRLFYILVERHFVSSRQKKRLVEEQVA